MPSFPDSAQAYRLPKSGEGIQSLFIQRTPVAKPKPTEVLVKIHAVALNYRDLLIATGRYPLGVKDDLVLGSDGAGEIIALGDDVRAWKIGDRVCMNVYPTHKFGQADAKVLATALGGLDDGVLIEYKTFPEAGLIRIPEHLSYEEASTLGGAGLTAYIALMGPVPLKGGDTVLVLGTGGVSIFALQFAVASGATVIVTSSSDDKLAIAKKLGAHHLVNYNKNPDWDKEVLKITEGRGANHIIEVGGQGTLAKSFQSVSYGGWIHSIGFLAEGGEPLNAGNATIFKGCMLRGIIGLSVTQFEDMNRLVSAAQIHPVVDKVFSFAETKEALEYLASQQFVGKVVVKVAEQAKCLSRNWETQINRGLSRPLNNLRMENSGPLSGATPLEPNMGNQSQAIAKRTLWSPTRTRPRLQQRPASTMSQPSYTIAFIAFLLSMGGSLKSYIAVLSGWILPSTKASMPIMVRTQIRYLERPSSVKRLHTSSVVPHTIDPLGIDTPIRKVSKKSALTRRGSFILPRKLSLDPLRQLDPRRLLSTRRSSLDLAANGVSFDFRKYSIDTPRTSISSDSSAESMSTAAAIVDKEIVVKKGKAILLARSLGHSISGKTSTPPQSPVFTPIIWAPMHALHEDEDEEEDIEEDKAVLISDSPEPIFGFPSTILDEQNLTVVDSKLAALQDSPTISLVSVSRPKMARRQTSWSTAKHSVSRMSRGASSRVFGKTTL
ncbi:hypothetical protein HWV62_241 [Athelia sp. TMB]|nr:hypothetical protein HWV62_241 [Athelia sp. TMB]